MHKVLKGSIISQFVLFTRQRIEDGLVNVVTDQATISPVHTGFTDLIKRAEFHDN